VRRPPQGRVVVVSPHLDDAVFSLGATMSRAAATGADVVSLTVFGCDPASTAPANGWDRRGGFSTEGEAATVRRQEDFEACKLLGVRPLWLAFRGGGYSPHKDEDAIAASVFRRLDGADAVLIPGWPLHNADHRWLADFFARHPSEVAHLGRYVEQPYAYNSNEKRPREWSRVRVHFRDRLRKQRALRSYASQLPLLSLDTAKLAGLAVHAERISWR
jgi:LmbE family N-acetylglucosaminyl deacetylase